MERVEGESSVWGALSSPGTAVCKAALWLLLPRPVSSQVSWRGCQARAFAHPTLCSPAFQQSLCRQEWLCEGVPRPASVRWRWRESFVLQGQAILCTPAPAWRTRCEHRKGGKIYSFSLNRFFVKNVLVIPEFFCSSTSILSIFWIILSLLVFLSPIQTLSNTGMSSVVALLLLLPTITTNALVNNSYCGRWTS